MVYRFDGGFIMKILSYTDSWTMTKEETVTYILDCFYDNYYAKLPKSSIYFVSIMSHSIRFIVRRKESTGFRTFELNVDNGFIDRVLDD